MSNKPKQTNQEEIVVQEQILAQPEPTTLVGEKNEVQIEQKKNFTVNLEFSSKIPELTKEEQEKKPPQVTLSIPTTSFKQLQEILINSNDKELAKGTKDAQWYSNLNFGAQNGVFADGLSGTTSREDADFVQEIQTPTQPIRGGVTKLNQKEGVKLVGDSRRMFIRTALGLGTLFTIPLMHSGFWMTLKSPSEAALLEFYRQVNSEKVELGRRTYGMIFSNTSAYFSKALLDFVVDHMASHSVKLKEGEDIKSYIRQPDLPILAWGLACATWPKGFEYSRSCLSEITECRHVTTEKLDLRKLQWNDRSSLTEHQIKHMANRTNNSMEPESIKHYVDSFLKGSDKTIKISDSVS
jgi:hypothetical protein